MATRLEPKAAFAVPDRTAVLKSLYYYRRTPAYVFLGILALGLLAALLIAPIYRSDARLLALTSDSYDVQTGSNTSPRSEPFKPDDVVNLEMQLLSSHDLHSAALTRLGGAPTNPVDFEKARQKFTNALSITRVSGANVIELGFADRDPARAQRALANVIAAYFEARARVLTSGRVALFEQQRSAAQNELAQANAALRDFQAKHGIADIDGQIAGAVSVDTALRQQQAEATSDLSGARSSLDTMRASAVRVPSTVEIYRDDTEATRAIAELQGQLLQLEAKRADLAGRYMAGSPLINQVDQQIAGLRKAIAGRRDLAEARRIGRNSYSDALQEQVREKNAAAAGEAARRAQLQKEIEASSARLLSLNAIAGTISELKLRRDAAQDRYRLLTSQVVQAQARETEAMNGTTNVRVIQQPNLPTGRSNSVPLLLAGAIVAGIVLAAAAAFVRVIARRTVLDADEAAASAQAPTIADLRHPALDDAGGAAGISARLFDASHPAEESGRVVAIVATRPEDFDWPLLAIVRELEAGGPGSAVAVHFANACYASADGRFGALVGSLSANSRAEINGAAACTIDEAAAQQLSALRSQHRWTILLVPPIGMTTAAPEEARAWSKLAAIADHVLLIVHVERTQQAAARKVAALLDGLGRPLTGLVVTGQRIEWPRFVLRR